MAAGLKGGAALSIGIDHPNYQHQISPAAENVRAALVADLGLRAGRAHTAAADPVSFSASALRSLSNNTAA